MSDNKGYTRVRDVMHTQLEMIDGIATVADAIKQMREQSCSSLIVDRRDETDEYGLITVQEIASEVIEKNLAAERVNIYQIMRKPVLAVRGDMNIRYAIRLLDQLNSRQAVVITNNQAIGIVTMYDMVIHYMDS